MRECDYITHCTDEQVCEKERKKDDQLLNVAHQPVTLLVRPFFSTPVN